MLFEGLSSGFEVGQPCYLIRNRAIRYFEGEESESFCHLCVVKSQLGSFGVGTGQTDSLNQLINLVALQLFLTVVNCLCGKVARNELMNAPSCPLCFQLSKGIML